MSAPVTSGKPRGRHPHQRLSALVVRNTRTPGRYADGDGLYLLVDAYGSKRWVLRMVAAGKRRDIGLGSVRVVSLAAARIEAARLRTLAYDGKDPIAERRRARHAIVPSFKDAATQWHTDHSQAFRNVKHRDQWLASLKAVAFPVFGDRSVADVTSADVLEALQSIWQTKPETARRVKQRIKVVLDWARAKGYRAGENPVDGITRALPKIAHRPVHHAALPYVEVPAFVASLRTASAARAVRLAFEFLILTAGRTNEVLQARWTEFDRDAKVWTIPAERMKAHRPHDVPLSERCLEILEEAAALADGGAFVFPGRTARRPLSNMAFLKLLTRIKRDDITAHGFRSSFRDWAAERTNFPRAVAEAALAHVVKDKTEAAYLRTKFFEQRCDLMNTWAKFATSTPADVVSIRA